MGELADVVGPTNWDMPSVADNFAVLDARSVGKGALTVREPLRIEVVVTSLVRGRDLIVAGVNQLPGVTCRSPRGAFYVFPNVKGLRMRSSEVAEALLNDAGVAALGGTAFGEYGEGFVRIALVENEQRIRQAARNVRRFLENAPEQLHNVVPLATRR